MEATSQSDWEHLPCQGQKTQFSLIVAQNNQALALDLRGGFQSWTQTLDTLEKIGTNEHFQPEPLNYKIVTTAVIPHRSVARINRTGTQQQFTQQKLCQWYFRSAFQTPCNSLGKSQTLWIHSDKSEFLTLVLPKRDYCKQCLVGYNSCVNITGKYWQCLWYTDIGNNRFPFTMIEKQSMLLVFRVIIWLELWTRNRETPGFKSIFSHATHSWPWTSHYISQPNLTCRV